MLNYQRVKTTKNIVDYLQTKMNYDELGDLPGNDGDLPLFINSEKKLQILAVWLRYHYGFGGYPSEIFFCLV